MAASRADRRAIDGILLLDKPTGISSNGALQRVKRLLRAEKAGHTGSLDPLASGMLPICLGEATKLASFLLDADKIYRVRLRVGARTDTGDADGTVVETGPTAIPEATLRQVVTTFVGPQQQVPPMYSALKRDGQPLYKLARAGQEVPREPRDIWIRRIDIATADPTGPELIVECSKGTYIRTLVEDIAIRAGTVAHVAALRRLAVGGFPPDRMVSMAEVEAAGAADAGDHKLPLLPPEAAVGHLPCVQLDEAQAARVRQGQTVLVSPSPPPGPIRLTGPREFVGIGESLGAGQCRPLRLLHPRSELPADCR